MSLLAHTPEDLPAVRQRLFELTKPVKLTAAEFTTYWPFVDNFWVTSNKSGLNQWYRCRLGLKKEAQKKHDNPKKRRYREVRIRTCPCRMVVAKTVEGDVTIQQTPGSEPHDHSLDVADGYKVNSYIRKIATEEGSKGHQAPVLTTLFRGLGRAATGREPLNEAGGRHIDTQYVYNQSIQWRKANPNQRLEGVETYHGSSSSMRHNGGSIKKDTIPR